MKGRFIGRILVAIMNNTPHIPERSAFTLIELLIVIAIIGILMSLLFPAVNSAIDAARKAQAKNDAVQIATAVIGYETEYGKLPTYTTTVDKALVETLAGIDTNANPRQIVFLEVQALKRGKGGTNSSGFMDPWTLLVTPNKTTPYAISMDNEATGGYDNTIKVSTNGAATGTVELRKKVAVWNVETNSRRMVRSWE